MKKIVIKKIVQTGTRHAVFREILLDFRLEGPW